MDRNQIIQNSIVSDMSEGVMTIRFNGVIEQVNGAALAILEKKEEELTGNTFLRAFFGGEENDAFIQCVLDAVYEKGKRKENYVPYQTSQGIKQLRGTGKGDLLFRVRVEVPRKLTEKQRELLEQFDATVSGRQYEAKKTFVDKLKDVFTEK